MKLLCRYCTSFALLVVLILPGLAEEVTAYRIDARLLSYDIEETGDRLISWIEEAGGYFLLRTDERIEARVPVTVREEIPPRLRRSARELLEYNFTATDLSGELRRAGAALNSREEVLSRTLAYLSSADFSSTLAIEKEVIRLIDEIEALKGTIAALETRSSYARLDLQLKSEAIEPQVTELSSFAWLNTFDFFSFIEKLPVKRRFYPLPRLGLPSEGPAGFSVYLRSVDFWAISPQGVRVRVRRLKPEPEMSLDFWREALGDHLAGAGYQPRGDSRRLGIAAAAGFAQMWLVPYNGEEYVYDIALIRRGKRLLVVESAGPLERYDTERPGMESWLQGLM